MAARVVEIESLPVLPETPLGARIAPELAAHPLAPYLGVRDRELANGYGASDGVFVAEGEVVVRVLAMRGRFRVRSLLLESRRVPAMRDVLEALPSSVTAYVAPQRAMDAIVGFPIHRGVLALGERGSELDPGRLLGDLSTPSLVVGLVGLANHDNVGSIFRNAAAFGVGGVLLDPTTCDPLYRKAIRVSVGMAVVVPFARATSTTGMLDELSRAGYEILALSPRASTRLDDLPPAPRRALLLGTEGPGLPEHVLARAKPVRIAMDPTLDSLNVAVASGIALYEASRHRRRDADEASAG